MKKITISLLMLFFASIILRAQGENDTWMADGIPFGGTNYGLSFSSGNPVVFNYTGTSLSSVQASQAVCDATGNTLFYTGGSSRQVFDHNGNVMPNGANLSYPATGTTYSIAPLIARNPGNNNQYYVFYQKNGNLYYSLVDMTLNNGLGDLVVKNVTLNGFAGINALSGPSKITLVQGCKSIWLVVRAKNIGEFHSYEISASGINTMPVISAVGSFPVAWYNGDVIAGRLKASPDGQRMAATISKFYDAAGNAYSQPKGGIELFDFEKCSGILKNAMVIDSTQHFDGIAFSPDNTKLYASSDTIVYQYDISLPTPAAILASKTYMLTNTVMPVWIVGCGWCDTATRDICDLKLATNGKIYMGNNRPDYCAGCMPSSAVNTFHSIEYPNMAGAGATPTIDVVTFPAGSFPVGLDLPPDIVLPPAVPDTMATYKMVAACYKDTFTLHADTSGACFLWEDGAGGTTHHVTQSGNYWVRYFGKNCLYHIDSFRVDIIPMPSITSTGYSCPDAFQGKAVIAGQPGPQQHYNFLWKDQNGNNIRTVTNQESDTVTGLNAGINYVQVTTSTGCDTTLSFLIGALPLPHAAFSADTIICNGEPLTFTSNSEVPLQTWDFGDGYFATDKNPIHSYNHGGDYGVLMTVKNIEGCTDTSRLTVHVKQLFLTLEASELLVERGTAIHLQSSAPEPYMVTAWQPGELFSSQKAVGQQVTMERTTTFTVSGISDQYGCKASADVTVKVEPFMLVPNAFSPNGDGLNDFFKPQIIGEGYHLNSFLIFNRWGQLIYEAHLDNGLRGWDGSYNGKAADIGTYFYRIEINTPSGKQVGRKGELTLLR